MKNKIVIQIVVLLALLASFVQPQVHTQAATITYNRDDAVNWAVSDNRNDGQLYGNSQGRYCVTYITKALLAGGLPGITIMNGLGAFVPWLQSHTDYWEYRPLDQLEKGDFIILGVKRLNNDPSPLIAWDLQHILLVTGSNLASSWNSERLNKPFTFWTGSYAQSIGIHIRTGTIAFVNGGSRPTIDENTVNNVVTADNLAGKTVYMQMWRGPVGNNPERVWNVQSVATGNVITFTDLDGSGPVYKDVQYYIVASLQPIVADEAKRQRTSCYSATGGVQLCDVISLPSNITPTPPAPTQTPTPPPPAEASASTSLASSLEVGQTTEGAINLLNVPAEGFVIAEFACNVNGLEVSNITEAGLFGLDPVFVPGSPQNGAFTSAIVVSNGQKATASGPALRFIVKALQAGQYSIDCKVRVSKDGNSLVEIPFAPASLTVSNTPTPTTPPPTQPPALQGTFSGTVVAAKPVVLTLKDQADNTLTITVKPDGAFSQIVPAGTYTATASAGGFLSAQASVVITANQVTTMPRVSLLAGDVNGDGKIDPLDVVTIGANYSKSAPAQADLNNDNLIDALDLYQLAQNYRKSGPIEWK